MLIKVGCGRGLGDFEEAEGWVLDWVNGDDFWLCTGEVGSRKNWFCFGHGEEMVHDCLGYRYGGDELIDLKW